MMYSRRWPVTLGCHGTDEIPHEPVTWLGTWILGDESTSEPACWVCGAHPYSTPARYIPDVDAGACSRSSGP